ncbi:glycosyltransferase [Desulfovibrio mangrovi]|uniref:glycosyltransferase n=1 Tax=Desulfovibrio mangrovi TaxID=2976983 RepID=UPI002246AE03|nr:glycosyltransferase [Desulfovibrio mangrovi]UZP66155.1 glycosyltransferase [Desulfovibrio mangrovi]
MQLVIEGFIYQVQAKGGISRVFNETLPRMCERDRNLRVTILTDGTSMQPLPRHPFIAYQYGECDPLLRSSRSAIWHSTYFTPPREWAGPRVVSLYDMVPERFSNLFCDPWDDALRERRKNAILDADRVIAISENTRQDVLDILDIDPAKVCVVHLSYNPLFRRLAAEELTDVAGGNPFFLYVGDRNHYKNFDGLLRGFAQWKHNGEADLYVVGKPLSDKETQLVTALGLQDRVKAKGMVSDEELCRYYNAAAGFVYPSYGEGFGIPLLEAMACGCPVIASDIPSSREVAGDVPFFFDPAQAEELATVFPAVLDEGHASERTRRGLEAVTTFSWEKTAADTLAVYRDLLSDMGRYDCNAFPSGHYYSPVPDLEDIAARQETVFGPADITDVDLRTDTQLALWEEMLAYRDEFPFCEEAGRLRYGLSNGFFGYGDAWSLYGMLRKFRPSRLIEVGSGHSSAAILDINDLFLDGGLQMTFIDPYPERLDSLLRAGDEQNATVLRQPVQQVDLDVFRTLEAGDVLFVDSSHVSKVGSDLNHLLFNVLPVLSAGVIVHFHDIFYPFEYPRSWVMGGRFWNECYMLRAFLQNNGRYEIMLFNSYLAQMFTERVSRDVPAFTQRDPANPWVEGCSSLWLRKR